MNFLPSHQRANKMNLFGLLEGHFLYRGPAGGRPERGHLVRGDAVTREKLRGTAELKEVFGTMKKRVDDYNQKYGVEPTRVKKNMKIRMGQKTSADVSTAKKVVPDGIKTIHYETIDFNPDELNTLKATDKAHLIPNEVNKTYTQMLTIMQAIEDKVGDKKEAKKIPQYKFLEGLAKSFQVLLTDLEALGYLSDRARLDKMIDQREFLSEAAKEKTKMEKKPAYGRAWEAFNDVVGDTENEDAFDTWADLSEFDKHEAKLQFMALMYGETNGFDDVFPPDFKNNTGPENAEEFPYMYRLYSERKGFDPQVLKRAQRHFDTLDKTVEGQTSAENILAVPGLPAGIKKLPAVPSNFDMQAWKKRADAIQANIHVLIDNAPNKTASGSPSWEGVAKSLEIHLDYAKAGYTLSKRIRENTKIEESFTWVNLNETDKQNWMEWSVQRFLKVRKMAIQPFGEGGVEWPSLTKDMHNAVIKHIWDNGVSFYKKNADGTVSFDEHNGAKYLGGITGLITSTALGPEKPDKHLSIRQQDVFLTTFLAGGAALIIEEAPEAIKVLEAWKELWPLKNQLDTQKAAGPQASETQTDFEARIARLEARFNERVRRKMGRLDADLVERFGQLSPSDLETKISKAKQNLERLKLFYEEALRASKNPESKETKNFIEAVMRGVYAEQLADTFADIDELDIIDRALIEQNRDALNSFQRNVEIFDYQDKNHYNIFEKMGLDAQDIYAQYIALIGMPGNEDLRIGGWEKLLFGTEAEFQRLIWALGIILHDDPRGGRRNFFAGLRILRSQHLDNKEIAIEDLADAGVVLEFFNTIRASIDASAEAKRMDTENKPALADSLRGGTAWDKVKKLGVSAYHFVAGRDTIDKVFFGLFAAGAGLKFWGLLRSTGPKAWAAQGLVGFLGADGLLKGATGVGILDMLKVGSVQTAGFHLPLVQSAEGTKGFEDITDVEHTQTLEAMDEVSFKEVMRFYHDTDKAGQPLPNRKGKVPDGINLRRIAPKAAFKKIDVDVEGRKRLKRVIEHFIGYVGYHNEEKADLQTAEDALIARWIDVPKEQADAMREVGRDPTRIAFGEVMAAEVGAYAAAASVKGTRIGRAEEGISDLWSDANKFAREIGNPTVEYWDQLAEYLGDKADDVKEFAIKAKKELHADVYFGAKWLELKWDQYEAQVKFLANGNAQLFVKGLKTAGGFALAADNFLITEVGTALDQVRTAITYADAPIEIGHSLQVSDFAPNINEVGSTDSRLNSFIRKVGNPRNHYGVVETLGNVTLNPAGAITSITLKPNQDDWHYVDPVTGATYVGVKVKPNDPHPDDPSRPLVDPVYKDNADRIFGILDPEARKKAIDMFIAEGVPEEYVTGIGNVERIVTFHKYTEDAGERESIVVFRVAGGKERYLHELGNLADYQQSKERENREMYEHDKGNTALENLSAVAYLKMPQSVREAVTFANGFLVLGPAAFEYSAREALKMLQYVAGLPNFIGFNIRIPQIGPNPAENAKQTLDMLTGAAKGSPVRPLSQFFSNANRSADYEIALRYAQFSGTKPYVGLLRGEPSFGSLRAEPGFSPAGFEAYDESPSRSRPGRYYVELYRYYLNHQRLNPKYNNTATKIRRYIRTIYGLGGSVPMPSRNNFDAWIASHSQIRQDYE